MEAPNDNCKHLSRSHGEISDQNDTIRSDKYNNKYICEYCHDTFKDLDFIKHKNLCQIYSSFYKKTISKTGRCFYQCLICPHETKSKTRRKCHIGEARLKIQAHLRAKHSEEIKKKLDFQKKNCNDVEIANQNDMIRIDSRNQQTCEYCHETFKGKVSDFSRHKKICQIYSRFYKKVVINKSGKFYYQCVICPYEAKLKAVRQCDARKNRARRALSSMARGAMHAHLRNKHSEKINKKLDLQKQNSKDSVSDLKVCEYCNILVSPKHNTECCKLIKKVSDKHQCRICFVMYKARLTTFEHIKMVHLNQNSQVEMVLPHNIKRKIDQEYLKVQKKPIKFIKEKFLDHEK